MSGKIENLEAEVGLNDELSGQSAASVAAERKLREMSLDDELADLKRSSEADLSATSGSVSRGSHG